MLRKCQVTEPHHFNFDSFTLRWTDQRRRSNHPLSSVHLIAVLQSPEQLVPPRCIGPLHPWLRLFPAFPSGCCTVPWRQEDPAGHLRCFTARSGKNRHMHLHKHIAQRCNWNWTFIPFQCLLPWSRSMKLCPRRGRSCRKSGTLTTSTSQTH